MTESSTFLAIDTATGPCSVAVWHSDAVQNLQLEMQSSAQASKLFPMIEECLRRSGIGYHDLTAVITTIGPGSFTGMRVGLSAARGIGLARNIPVLGYTTLEVLAFSELKLANGREILAVLNAGKGEYSAQQFSSSPDFRPLADPVLESPEVLSKTITEKMLITGNTPLNNSNVPFPRADLLAELAAHYPALAKPPVPFYVRPPDAKISVAS